MFRKVLIAEDFDSINIAVIQVLEELEVVDFHHAKYCDDALLKIKRALHDKQPFDLLITDLSFRPDGRESKITSGEALIGEIRKLQPELQIIVYSIEDRPVIVKSLFEKSLISAYVLKGRNSIPELKNAIHEIYGNDEKYISPELAYIRTDKSVSEIDSYDIELLKLLAKGLKQEAIARQFQVLGISPNSTSAVEKRISRLKIYFQANNSVQIVVMAKDLGFI